jgi:hypothetical protein
MSARATNLRTLLASISPCWRVTYPDGSGRCVEVEAECETTARLAACGASRLHGSATVTNRDGLVASYVSGSLLVGAA